MTESARDWADDDGGTPFGTRPGSHRAAEPPHGSLADEAVKLADAAQHDHHERIDDVVLPEIRADVA